MDCRLCGTEIGRGMRRCTRCGLRLSRSGWATVLGAFVVAAALTVASLVAYQHRNEIAEALHHRLQPEPDVTTTLGSPPTPIDVSSDRLQADYAANEVAADQRYRGQLLRVTGAVKAIRRVLDSPYLDLRTTSEIYKVTAYFDMKSADELARIKVNDHVTVRCIGAGEIMGPRLRECVLE